MSGDEDNAVKPMSRREAMERKMGIYVPPKLLAELKDALAAIGLEDAGFSVSASVSIDVNHNAIPRTFTLAMTDFKRSLDKASPARTMIADYIKNHGMRLEMGDIGGIQITGQRIRDICEAAVEGYINVRCKDNKVDYKAILDAEGIEMGRGLGT